MNSTNCFGEGPLGPVLVIEGSAMSVSPLGLKACDYVVTERPGDDLASFEIEGHEMLFGSPATIDLVVDRFENIGFADMLVAEIADLKVVVAVDAGDVFADGHGRFFDTQALMAVDQDADPITPAQQSAHVRKLANIAAHEARNAASRRAAAERRLAKAA